MSPILVEKRCVLISIPGDEQVARVVWYRADGLDINKQVSYEEWGPKSGV